MKKSVKKRGVKRSIRIRKDKRDMKKSFPYKLLKICLILLVLLIISWIITAIIGYEPQEKGGGGLGGELGSLKLLGGEELQDDTTAGFIPNDCGDSQLEDVWNYIFQGNYNEDDMTFVSDKDAIDNCTKYLIYNVGEGNIVRILIGDFQNNPQIYEHNIEAYYGNFTDDFITQLQGTIVSNYIDVLKNDLSNNMWDARLIPGNRSLKDSSEANDEHHSVFKIQNQTWELESEFYSNVKYFFGERFVYTPIEGLRVINHSEISRNKTLNHLKYSESYLKIIDLTQIEMIPNIMFYGSKNFNGAYDLEDYFKNVGLSDENLNFTYNASIPNSIQLIFNRFSGRADMDASSGFGGEVWVNITLSYPGLESVTSNNFKITIINCSDPDNDMGHYKRIKTTTWNASTSKVDYCVSTSQIMEYKCDSSANVVGYSYSCSSGYDCLDGACVINTSINHAPDFKSNVCGDIDININNTQTYILNISKCFEDDDNDSMVYRFNNDSMKNITLVRNNTKITLTAKTGFLGNEYFYLYANDSKSETRGEIDVSVINYSGPNLTNPPPPQTNDTQIVSSNPVAGDYNLFTGEGKNFSINPKNYNSIRWFLNDVLVASDVLNYGTGSLNDGTYVLRAEISGPTGVDSKTWTILVGDEEVTVSVSFGKVIFWSIVAVIVIIILLVIWLFIIEKNKKNHGRINGGLGTFTDPKTSVGRPLKSEIYKSPGS